MRLITKRTAFRVIVLPLICARCELQVAESLPLRGEAHGDGGGQDFRDAKRHRSQRDGDGERYRQLAHESEEGQGDSRSGALYLIVVGALRTTYRRRVWVVDGTEVTLAWDGRYLVEMGVKYAELAESPAPLSSGYAALLDLKGIR